MPLRRSDERQPFHISHNARATHTRSLGNTVPESDVTAVYVLAGPVSSSLCVCRLGIRKGSGTSSRSTSPYLDASQDMDCLKPTKRPKTVVSMGVLQSSLASLGGFQSVSRTRDCQGVAMLTKHSLLHQNSSPASSNHLLRLCPVI